MDSESGPSASDIGDGIDQTLKDETGVTAGDTLVAEKSSSTAPTPDHSSGPSEEDRAALQGLLEQLGKENIDVGVKSSSDQSGHPDAMQSQRLDLGDIPVQNLPHDESAFQEGQKPHRVKGLFRVLGVASTIFSLLFRR